MAVPAVGKKVPDFELPATGGGPFERLQLALRRLPPAIAALDERVRKDPGLMGPRPPA